MTSSKPSTPLTKKPPLPALQRTASESVIMRSRRMELGGLHGLQGLQGQMSSGGGGKLVHDALFSPSGSVGSAGTTVSDEGSVRRAFSMVQYLQTSWLDGIQT